MRSAHELPYHDSRSGQSNFRKFVQVCPSTFPSVMVNSFFGISCFRWFLYQVRIPKLPPLYLNFHPSLISPYSTFEPWARTHYFLVPPNKTERGRNDERIQNKQIKELFGWTGIWKTKGQSRPTRTNPVQTEKNGSKGTDT